MAEKTIAIVGAGIAGLSAGCYGRMNGYRTILFEQHDLPGGLLTSWRRNGYTIDGCIHWLVGTSPRSPFFRIWREIGALEGRRFVYPDVYMRVEGEDGRAATFYTDLHRLEAELAGLSPEDRKTAEAFVRDTRALTRFVTPLPPSPGSTRLPEGIALLLRVAPYLRLLRRWGGTSLAEFAARFRDPLLRQAFVRIWLPQFPALWIMMNLAWMQGREAGYPIGGSLEIARAVERRYLALGGEIRYRARAVRVLVEANRAVGVRLADGSEHRADDVVAAGDLHTAVFDLLGGAYADDAVRGYFESLRPFPPLVQVALGVEGGIPGYGPALFGLDFPVDPPLTVAGETVRRVNAHAYVFDPTLAPAGKTIIKVLFLSDFASWKTLAEDPRRYGEEKDRIAAEVIDRLDRRFPGLGGRVEMRDVATPVTWHRYTGNWKGSFQGWLMTPANWTARIRKTLPGLSRFHLAGHWTEPGGGLPPSALSGRHAIQGICRRDGIPFRTSLP